MSYIILQKGLPALTPHHGVGKHLGKQTGLGSARAGLGPGWLGLWPAWPRPGTAPGQASPAPGSGPGLVRAGVWAGSGPAGLGLTNSSEKHTEGLDSII